MMHITVRLFAILKDKAGVSQIELELPDESNVAAAVDAIQKKYPAISSELSRAAIAVNRDYVKRESVLREGDELALIPPVSGG